MPPADSRFLAASPFGMTRRVIRVRKMKREQNHAGRAPLRQQQLREVTTIHRVNETATRVHLQFCSC